MRLHRLLPSLVGATLFAVACSGGSASGGSAAADPGPLFDSAGGRTVTCMVHQPAPPGSRYTDPQSRDSAQVLTLAALLHGQRLQTLLRRAASQCPRSALAQLYIDLGADPAAVRRLLPG